MLEDVFECFDELVEKYDLEKIKTIGDCYMVASGVPRPRSDHASALVDLALEVRAAVATRTFGGHKLAFRIGINSGPVVAGVIGRKKFIYDLWGDAVNIASRMESQGQSGSIQITRATYDLVGADFECEPRGRAIIKGSGELEVWHVAGAETGPAARQRCDRGTVVRHRHFRWVGTAGVGRPRVRQTDEALQMIALDASARLASLT